MHGLLNVLYLCRDSGCSTWTLSESMGLEIAFMSLTLTTSLASPKSSLFEDSFRNHIKKFCIKLDLNFVAGYGKMPEYEHIFTDFLLSLAPGKYKKRSG